METEINLTKPYAKGPYDECRLNQDGIPEQRLRLSEGCPNRCPFCRESRENPELKVFPIPEIKRNLVTIMDMNILCHPEALSMIQDLGSRRVDDKVVYYEFICGVDYRFFTPEICKALKDNRFQNIRIAWDFSITYQRRIKAALKMLFKAGYKHDEVTVFMICNWKTPYAHNCAKLDLCKVWGVKASDCYFDNQVPPNIKPIYWTKEQIEDFRPRVRKHNQLVRFEIDPELPENGDLNEIIEVQ